MQTPSNVMIDGLPSGWSIVQRNDLFRTISVKAPNGYTAVLTSVDCNPSNVFYMLVKDLIDETERKRKQAAESTNTN